MKKLLLILILTFNFQCLSKADDVRDFQLEGIGIGDSLLDFYSKEAITNLEDGKKIFYDDKEFYDLQLNVKNFESWAVLSFSVKSNDKKLIIHNISGGEFFENNLTDCKKKQKMIVKDLTENFFQNTKVVTYDYVYKSMADGKSISFIEDFSLPNGNLRVYCTDWSKQTEVEVGYSDNLRIEIGTEEYFEWLNTKAYK